MPVWAIIVVQWLHVLFGIFWFGSRLTGNFILHPVMRRVKQAAQAAFLHEFVAQLMRVEPVLGVMTILLGILRGTVFGSVTSTAIAFGTPYGLTWTTALALGVATILVGVIFMRRAFARLRAIPVAADGSSQAAFDAQLRTVGAFSNISLALFLGVFSCMILMRFGY